MCNMSTTNLTFVPLSTVSNNAQTMTQAVRDEIRAGIEKGAYTEGIRKQYELQLRWLEQEVPGLEMMFAPGPIVAPRESLLGDLEPEDLFIVIW